MPFFSILFLGGIYFSILHLVSISSKTFLKFTFSSLTQAENMWYFAINLDWLSNFLFFPIFRTPYISLLLSEMTEWVSQVNHQKAQKCARIYLAIVIGNDTYTVTREYRNNSSFRTVSFLFFSVISIITTKISRVQEHDLIWELSICIERNLQFC